MTEEEILELLDKAGLTEERAKTSRKIFLMRNSIICKYILYMTRSEAVAYLFNLNNDAIICERTYDRYIEKALDKMNKIK